VAIDCGAGALKTLRKDRTHRRGAMGVCLRFDVHFFVHHNAGRSLARTKTHEIGVFEFRRTKHPSPSGATLVNECAPRGYRGKHSRLGRKIYTLLIEVEKGERQPWYGAQQFSGSRRRLELIFPLRRWLSRKHISPWCNILAIAEPRNLRGPRIGV